MNAAGLKDLYERKARAMARRPSFGRSSGQARVRLQDGLSCDVEHEDRMIVVDQPPEEGGTGRGPHPGQLMRASLAACLAQGYRIWGARLGVPIDEVEIEVVCEYDARGQVGVADVPIGWQRIAFDVRIRSSATLAEVERVVETANRQSPMLANLAPTIEQEHKLTVGRRAPTSGVSPASPSRA